MSKRWFSRTITIAVTVLLAGCGSSDPVPTLDSITLALAVPAVKIGQTSQATVTLKDTNGNPFMLSDAVLSYSSSDNTIAAVSTSGLVTAFAPGTATITASALSKSGTASFQVTPAQLTVTTQPSGAVSDQNLTAQPVVQIRDVATNTVIPTATSPVAVAIASGSGTLGGTATVNATAGVASFAGLKVVGTGSHSFTFTSKNITTATSSTFTVSAPTTGVALTGTVATGAGAAVGGGTVEILTGTTITQTATVAGNGTYSVSTLAAGTYGVRLQPPLTHSMGPSEPVQQSVTIPASQTTAVVQNFVVQAAIYSDDFQSYTSTTLKTGCTGTITAGSFFFGPSQVMGSCGEPAQITMDNTGGNSTGPKAVRYDWPARPTGVNYSLYLGPRINAPPVSTQYWVRWTSKESPGFAHGGNGATGSANSYKFFLMQLGNCPAGCAQFGVYLENTNPSPALGVDPTSIAIDANDRLGNATGLVKGDLGSSWSGQWHTWVAHMNNLGTTTTTFTLYKDGVVFLATNPTPYQPGTSVGGTGQILFINMGSNINNGPNLAQSRWWREFGIYTTRPSLRPMPP